MNIAVFSDVHGRILLAFALCTRWERETGERIDLILQAGDLGAYPDETRLDRATRQHAKADPAELGFLTDFVTLQPDVAAILGTTTAPMICVRGNHEDHAWLDALEAQARAATFPIDAYGRIFCLKTGVLYTTDAAGADHGVSLLGIGRIAASPGARDPTHPKFIQPDELQRLRHLATCAPDILLTHDVPRERAGGRGMAAIREALDTCRPVYHFYGHTEEPFRRQRDRNGVTRVIRMADLNWNGRDRPGMLLPGVMGILRWHDREHHAFEVVDAPWLSEYAIWNWRSTAEAYQVAET